MSLCGELEISQDEMSRAIKSVIRSADLVLKYEESMAEAIEIHKESVELFDDIYQRFLEIHKIST